MIGPEPPRPMKGARGAEGASTALGVVGALPEFRRAAAAASAKRAAQAAADGLAQPCAPGAHVGERGGARAAQQLGAQSHHFVAGAVLRRDFGAQPDRDSAPGGQTVRSVEGVGREGRGRALQPGGRGTGRRAARCRRRGGFGTVGIHIGGRSHPSQAQGLPPHINTPHTHARLNIRDACVRGKLLVLVVGDGKRRVGGPLPPLLRAHVARDTKEATGRESVPYRLHPTAIAQRLDIRRAVAGLQHLHPQFRCESAGRGRGLARRMVDCGVVFDRRQVGRPRGGGLARQRRGNTARAGAAPTAGVAWSLWHIVRLAIWAHRYVDQHLRSPRPKHNLRVGRSRSVSASEMAAQLQAQLRRTKRGPGGGGCGV
eukprot:scaffold18154_cov92-Isochrysis_galbana.AAC.2